MATLSRVVQDANQFFPTAHDFKLENYTNYLKLLYKAKTPSQACADTNHWPPPVTNKVFRLAMIMAEKVQRRNIEEDFVRDTITGKVDDLSLIHI